ncbi:unnamed protein product [Penicillium salamii]|uniref:Zn(2)-C6 fungal-type domain-containing protein n=1 Tax=Penicillium salamii TaxID=1612424 RepID=A0A9W4JXJ2_9EURO|nr:unnamed protein product [Penicillium salamii]CAG8026278.1 unnamed protein product [Penicillium salamii]CAG8061327.1 unnamed protein product [Penicillium salamii]CAG8081724.1 unnamed protein product [Penicillium salamii]CAG8185746.1 unnamed protein product [Penicillium salamii]
MTYAFHERALLITLQVRCDRKDPCGNCQDAEIPCERQRAAKRRCTGKPRREISSPGPSRIAEIQSIPNEFDELVTPNEMVPFVPISQAKYQPNVLMAPTQILYDPVYDAQSTIQRQLRQLPGLTLDRRSVLETALSVMNLLSDNTRIIQETQSGNLGAGSPRIPPTEFLAWMLKDIPTDRFGPFVADYFRHLSTGTLKRMGLALLHKKASPHESIIYTVCVNAVAYKFLTTVISLEDDPDLALELRKNATEYRAAAQTALKQIPLLISPSLGLLQAILCGVSYLNPSFFHCPQLTVQVFLHQGSGDVGLSGDLTKAACKTCTDLDLPGTVLRGHATEEELFCFLWCYTLDRNHAYKVRTSRCLLDVHLPATFADLYPTFPNIAELLLIYLDLARVQDTVVSYLPDSTAHHASSLYETGEYMLVQMQYIQQRLNQLDTLSSEWKGLDRQTEMSALRFAYQSVMTGILYLLQTDSDQPPRSTDGYLQSARQELSALVSMCHTAEKQTAVTFLNWTILLYPATAYLVLFCNVVATSDIGDFNLMKSIADCLSQSGISYPLVQLRTLFQNFLGLSQGFFGDERNMQVLAEPDTSYPVNPFMIWDNTEFSFDESFSGMLGMSETELLLPYGDLL